MPLSVVQLVPNLESGGVERGTLEVAAELHRRGHRSIVISAGGRLVAGLEQAGTEHYTWPIGAKSPLTLGQVLRLRRFLQRQRIDILHARSRVPAWVGYLAWRSMPPRQRPGWVTTVHGLYSVNRYSAIMASGQVVIAVSETVRRYLLENYPATDPQRIRVIPRGVGPEEFPHGHRPPPGIRESLVGNHPGPVLTLPGRLTRLKGHQDFCELLRRLPQAVGLVVGDEDPRRRAYAAAIRQQAPPNVIFTGHRADMKDVLAASDLVFSLSAKPESFGRSALEALSLGVPVVGYDHGGIGEVLAELFPAGRVPLHDLEALTQRTRQLLAAPVVVAENRRFLLSSMLEQTLAVYSQLRASPPQCYRATP